MSSHFQTIPQNDLVSKIPSYLQMPKVSHWTYRAAGHAFNQTKIAIVSNLAVAAQVLVLVSQTVPVETLLHARTT